MTRESAVQPAGGGKWQTALHCFTVLCDIAILAFAMVAIYARFVTHRAELLSPAALLASVFGLLYLGLVGIMFLLASEEIWRAFFVENLYARDETSCGIRIFFRVAILLGSSLLLVSALAPNLHIGPG